MPVTTDRPAEFDAKVMQYYGALKTRAWRVTKDSDRAQSLAADTVILALEKWQTYREGKTMWPWLVWLMRDVAKRRWSAANSLKRTPRYDANAAAHQPAAQEHFVDLVRITETLSQSNDGRTLLAHALGHTSADMAAARGISRQGVTQAFGRARKALFARGL